jgi:hypothetical protein
MVKKVEGGCLCEKIRYSFQIADTIDKVQSNHCHCTMCRKASGSGITTFITIPKILIEFKGTSLTKYKSSENCTRSFCSNCGSQISWENNNDDNIDIGIGTLDDPKGIIPKYHLWVENKILPIDLNIPKYLQNYKSSLLK